MDLNGVLTAGVRMGASDIHLSANSPPLARVSCRLVEIPGFGVLSPDACKALVYSCIYEEKKARLEQELELDTSLLIPNLARFRLNALHQRGCVEAVFRVIPARIPTPQALGLDSAAVRLAELSRGLVLVTGPAGSGKTTTLASLVEHINKTARRHIVTIEDPVEYVFERKLSLIRQREVGLDTRSFRNALRQALRQDPDVILVGELRDLETISLALTAAETGHLCLATLHTPDAAQAVDRIVDVFPPEQQQQVRVQLAGTLRGVLAQLLFPRTIEAGRIAARELLIVTPAAANLIREGKSHMLHNLIQTGGKYGMYTMDHSIDRLVRNGVVAGDDALARALQPELMAESMGSRATALAALPESTEQR